MKTLMEDMGVNLAGVEVIERLTRHMAELQRRVEEMESELKRLREVSEE